MVQQSFDELNQKVVTPAQLQQWFAAGQVPRVMCLRNEMRKHFNWRLACLHLQHLKVRPIVWFAKDALSLGRGKKMPANPDELAPLPAVVRAAVELLNASQTGKIPTMQMYFPGCRYAFTTSPAANLGFVNNAECIGEGIALHPDEQDDGEHGCWFLKRPPVAVFVRPVEARVGAAADAAFQPLFPGMPAGCVPVAPGYTDSFEVQITKEKKGPDGKVHRSQHKYNVRRYGLPLSDAYAVTDYYCQGLSFKDAPWMAHLNLPPTGTFSRPNMFVGLSRWGAWANVWLIAPLWRSGDARGRNEVIDAFHKIACLEPDLKKELRRLRAAADACKVTYAE